MAVDFDIDEYEDGSILVRSITVDGETVYGRGEETLAVPKSIISKTTLKEMDTRVWLEPVDRVSDEYVMLSTVPYRLRAIDAKSAEVVFDETCRLEFWDGPVELGRYMESKKLVIEYRQKATNDISLVEYDDNDDYISLIYRAQFDGVTVGEVIEQAEQLATEIDGATDIALGSPIKAVADCASEREFTLGVVIPLLRCLGFSNVKYNHGKREYGKDITFARLTEFDEYERWGAQIKQGDVGGGVNSEVDEIVAQAEDAFKMPYNDVYTREKARIAKMLVVINGRFTENAVEKICEKIESHALRNNIIFIDSEKIEVLAERYRIAMKRTAIRAES
ncbi:MAG: hypothetical protein KF859_05610 [Phycisphaeraceae bacterium]|nr:hypothetical protein [Phycisphaeraceae bacterium]